MAKLLRSFGLLLALALFGCSTDTQRVADTIYSGGLILTIDDEQPIVEAVAVRDGRILAVGDTDSVLAFRGDSTEIVDLAGRTMLPGFVDSHGHVVMGGLQALSANLLAPPDGEVTDIASLKAALSAWVEENSDFVDEANLIIGFGYDNAQLSEVRHPTRQDLDEVSADIPIFDGVMTRRTRYSPEVRAASPPS
jgi:predicted amidohydrolase YtcJ